MRKNNECTIDGCQRRLKSRGMCGTHYEWWRRHNRDLVGTPSSKKWVNSDGSRVTCSFEGCPDLVYLRDMCQYHYGRDRRIKKAEGAPIRANRRLKGVTPTCAFNDCEKPEFSPGWCAGHYYQVLEGRPLRELRAKDPCPVSGCTESYTVRSNSVGLCRRHAALQRKFSLSRERLLELHENLVCSNAHCGNVDNLHLDHDHSCCGYDEYPSSTIVSCGECVRGWLCRTCNLALGMVNDDKEKLQGLLDFLSR